MDVPLALQRAVRGFKLGTAALAAHMGISTTSLNHKVSPDYPTAHVSPDEMLQILDATGDHGAFYAMADRLGYVVFPVPAASLAGDEATTALANTVREFGEFIATAAADLADGRVTSNELQRIEREASEAIAAIHKLVGHAQAQHARSRPLHAVAGGR